MDNIFKYVKVLVSDLADGFVKRNPFGEGALLLTIHSLCTSQSWGEPNAMAFLFYSIAGKNRRLLKNPRK